MTEWLGNIALGQQHRKLWACGSAKIYLSELLHKLYNGFTVISWNLQTKFPKSLVKCKKCKNRLQWFGNLTSPYYRKHVTFKKAFCFFMKTANSCVIVWSDGCNISNIIGMEVAKGRKAKQLEEVSNMIGYKKEHLREAVYQSAKKKKKNRLHKVSNKFRIMFDKIKLLRLTSG